MIKRHNNLPFFDELVIQDVAVGKVVVGVKNDNRVVVIQLFWVKEGRAGEQNKQVFFHWRVF